MTDTVTLKPLTADQKQKILAAILDWELDTPAAKRTERRRRTSSQKIASDYKVSTFQVGGIRSNMAAGKYGSMKTLRAKRRKARNATA
jgi:hypothetical protein